MGGDAPIPPPVLHPCRPHQRILEFPSPPEMRAAFRFRSRPRGQVFALDRLPFGWQFSPIFCQRTLGDLVRPLVPPHMELLHYLDDFLIVGSNPEEVQAVTDRIVEAASSVKSPHCSLSRRYFSWVSGWTWRLGRLGPTLGLFSRCSMPRRAWHVSLGLTVG